MDSMQNVLHQLGRLDGKMDAMLLRQAHHEQVLEKHDERIKFLESRWAYVLGAAAVVALIISYALK